MGVTMNYRTRGILAIMGAVLLGLFGGMGVAYGYTNNFPVITFSGTLVVGIAFYQGWIGNKNINKWHQLRQIIRYV